MAHFQADLTNYIHGAIAMHIDPDVRYAQAEQLASLIAAKVDHLKRHGSPTVDNTQYAIVTLPRQEYGLLKTELQEWRARCRELSSAGFENMSNRRRLQQAESFLKAQRAQISALQNEIRELKAENEIPRYDPLKGAEEQDRTPMNASSR